jgi:hypothetical protein
LSPALLLGVCAHLFAGEPAALVALLLVVLVPCLAVLVAPPEAGEGADLLAMAVLVVATALFLTANLLVIGDVATALGAPRWYGVVTAAACALGLTLWPWTGTWWPWLAPAGLGLLGGALVIVAQAAGVGPAAAWSDVASRPAFRFAADSPWVVSGGTFSRPGSLRFSEPHTVRAVGPAVFTVIIADAGASSVQEWRPEPGETITLRPGDQLSFPAGARLRFERGKRVPGAPDSGVIWADPATHVPRPTRLLEILGLAVTLVGGSVPLLRLGPPPTRAGALAGLGVLLPAAAWAEGWAVYGSRAAPDLFLDGVRTGALARLPALAVGGAPGRRLAWLVAVALTFLLVATAAGLRERIAALDPDGGELARDPTLWTAVFGVAVFASLWPHDSWALLLLAFGVLAATLGAAALAAPAAPAATRVIASVLGLIVFAAVGLGSRAVPGALAESLATYPALVAAPVTWSALRLAAPRPR